MLEFLTQSVSSWCSRWCGSQKQETSFFLWNSASIF